MVLTLLEKLVKKKVQSNCSKSSKKPVLSLTVKTVETEVGNKKIKTTFRLFSNVIMMDKLILALK